MVRRIRPHTHTHTYTHYRYVFSHTKIIFKVLLYGLLTDEILWSQDISSSQLYRTVEALDPMTEPVTRKADDCEPSTSTGITGKALKRKVDVNEAPAIKFCKYSFINKYLE